MIIRTVEVKNFGSYKHFKFSYDSIGTTLISGATGSGKTTFLDIPSWTLYGLTSKNGPVDDVCSWFSDKHATEGKIQLDVKGSTVVVVRIRSKTSKNDLFYTVDDSEPKRGKDLIETQSLINSLTGMDGDTFLLSCYFNEFSETVKFFSSNAKDRRKLFEKITNLTFPKALSLKAQEKSKSLKKYQADNLALLHNEEGRHAQCIATLSSLQKVRDAWGVSHSNTIESLSLKSKNFMSDKQKRLETLKVKSFRHDEDRTRQIDDIIDKIDLLDEQIKPTSYFESLLIEQENNCRIEDAFCGTCNQLLPEQADIVAEIQEKKLINARLLDKRAVYVQDVEKLRKQINPFYQTAEAIKLEKNHFNLQLKEEKQKINPLIPAVEEQQLLLNSLQGSVEGFSKLHTEVTSAMGRMTTLGDFIDALRTRLLAKSIAEVQTRTNNIISEHFNGEFCILFTPESGDSLKVEIKKNGYSCNFSQLSKGQRQILKLSFSLAIMKVVQNQHKIDTKCLFFDEPSDGLDEELKEKCVALISSLSLDNAFVVEHSQAAKSLFTNQYKIRLENDNSEVVKL